MNIERYPLTWPEGRPRRTAGERIRSPFCRANTYPKVWHSLIEAVRFVQEEIARLENSSDLIVSTNFKLRVDGLPYSGQAQPKDPGAAVYFKLNGKPVSFANDKYDRVECNLWAIGLTIEATRGIERWGAATQQQSFRGFLAIAEKTGGLDPYALLGLTPGCTEDELKAAYRKAASKYHPDVPLTGNHAKWCEIQDAHNLIAQNIRGA